ncbi:MAG TPA: O-antigen ligase family protein [Vicingaceae bacterium]
MSRKIIHNQLHYILAVLIAFSLPLATLTPILIVLFALNWIVEGDFLEKLNNIKQNKVVFVFISLYIVHLLGLIYTDNLKSGWFDMEVKLSLLVFPLIIGSKPLTEKQVRGIIKSLIISIIYVGLYLISRAIIFYFFNHENVFYYQLFSPFIHPSYLSMYINMAVAWVLYQNYNGKKVFTNAFIVDKLLVLYLFAITFLLASKSGIFLFIIIVFVYLCLEFYKNRKMIHFAVGSLIILLSFIALSYFSPKNFDRIIHLIETINSNDIENNSNESSSLRLHLWSTSNEVIKKSFLVGYGTGDGKDVLNKALEEKEITNAFKNKLNAHNAFYEIFLKLGVVGFVVLLLNIIFPSFIAFKQNNILYLFLVIILVFNFSFESMLETKAGVIFYAFFNSLIFFKVTVNENNNHSRS